MRSIDKASEATCDLVALNNMVVNMRSVVKASKVHVIHGLSRTIKKLKTKRGTEDQKEKNLRKAQRLLDEIFTIKELNVDKVTKFALSNTQSFAEMCKQPSTSIEARSLARLSEYKLLSAKVTVFRQSHSDWQDLAAYLCTKQSGRRFKTKEQKMRAAKKGSKFLPLAATKDGDKKDNDKKDNAQKETLHQQQEESTVNDCEQSDDDDSDGNETKADSEADSNAAIRDCHTHNISSKAESDNDDAEDDVEKSEEDDLPDNSNCEQKVDDNDDAEDDVEKSEEDDLPDNSNCEQKVDDEDEDDSADERDDEDKDDSADESEESYNTDASGDSSSDNTKEQRTVPCLDNTKDESDSDEPDEGVGDTVESHRKDDSSESETMELVTKAPAKKSLVADPFFMSVSDDDADTVSHWIDEESADKISQQYARKPGQRGMGNKPWQRQEDSRWLKGDYDGTQTRGRHFGGRGNFRGRGRERGRGDSHRDRGGRQSRGGNRQTDWGHKPRGQGHRGRGGAQRGRGGRDRDQAEKSFGRGGSFRGFQDGRRTTDHDSQSSFKHQGSKTSAPAVQADNAKESSHPSWEAHRKRKELEKTASFSGKRIKFDD